jgi:hypothetical protein
MALKGFSGVCKVAHDLHTDHRQNGRKPDQAIRFNYLTRKMIAAYPS